MKQIHFLILSFLMAISCGNRVESPLAEVTNKTPGITVNQPPTLLLSESGTTSSLSVMLDSSPSGDVVISVSVSNPAEGTIIVPFSGNSGALTFTPQNWYVPQVITLQGVDDDNADGNQPLTLLFGTPSSLDTRYDGQFKPTDITFTTVDNETAGITIKTGSQPLYVSESGTTSSFDVVLNSLPAATVTLPISVSISSEGTVTSPFSGTAGTLTFTPANWNIPQTVTVQGVPDGIADGNRPFTVNFGTSSSTDPVYNATFTPMPVNFVNIDADKAGVTVNAAPQNLVMEGGSSTFQVFLNSIPTGNVSIAVSSSDTTIGTVTTPAAGIVNFTPTDWNVPKTVTVQGVANGIADGNRPFAVSFTISTADTVYGALTIPPVNFLNVDTDKAGVTISATPTNLVMEGGSTAFEIVLNSIPTGNVNITVSSSDTTRGTVITTPVPGIVTFTSTDWNVPKTVTVQGVPNGIADGDRPFTVNLGSTSSSDPAYSGTFTPPAVNFLCVDTDKAGITVSALPLNTVLENGSATFQIVLNSIPTANVDITVSSSNTTYGTVTTILGGGLVQFTPGNWNTPQTVTVQGSWDHTAGLDKAFTIDFPLIVSGDPSYSAITVPSLNWLTVDIDHAGVTFTEQPGFTFLVDNGMVKTSAFDIKLNSIPAFDVTMSLYSTDPTVGTVSGPTIIAGSYITFTPGNWNIVQSFTVQGTNTGITQNTPFQIIIGSPVSTDPIYNNTFDPSDLNFVAVHNSGPAGITIYKGNTLITSGNPATNDFFEVVLNSQPAVSTAVNLLMTIMLDPSAATFISPFVGNPITIIFDPSNWNIPQRVSVKGGTTAVPGIHPYSISIDPLTSTDGSYSPLPIITINGFNSE